MSNGYIKVYRSLCEKGYYTQSEYVHLWLHLLMRATYQPREFLFNGKIRTLKPGQLITGRNVLSAETGINRSKIDRILQCFESEHQIEQQMSSRFRCITIVNWESYQQSEPHFEPQMSHKCAASEPQVSTYNKDKKDKKEKKVRNRVEYDPDIQFGEIVGDLNERRIKAGLPGQFQPTTESTRKAIAGRWAEGYRLPDFQRVHAVKVAEWANGEFAKYLTPETLYRPGHFEKYLNQQGATATDDAVERARRRLFGEAV